MREVEKQKDQRAEDVYKERRGKREKWNILSAMEAYRSRGWSRRGDIRRVKDELGR